MDFVVPERYRVKIKKKAKELTNISVRTEKTVELESDCDMSFNWRAWNGPPRLVKKTGGIGNQRKNRVNSNCGIVDIS